MDAAIASKPSHLEPSPLGTKEYWDGLYTTELTNHDVDPTDVGTIWFDDSSAEDKLVSFLAEKIVHEKILGEEVGRHNCSFLDLGTGNGHFLERLREGGENDDEDEDVNQDEDEDANAAEEGQKANGAWVGRMMGVDYSQRSIEFAKRIAEGKGYGIPGTGKPGIEFVHWDIMKDSPQPLVLSGPNADGWNVVLDKGTFDAISLSEETDEDGRRICEGYRERVVRLVREGGFLLVTSCNWTEGELTGWFCGQRDVRGKGSEAEKGRLEVLDVIKYKSYRFGGREGQSISSVCFRKRENP